MRNHWLGFVSGAWIPRLIRKDSKVTGPRDETHPLGCVVVRFGRDKSRPALNNRRVHFVMDCMIELARTVLVPRLGSPSHRSRHELCLHSSSASHGLIPTSYRRSVNSPSRGRTSNTRGRTTGNVTAASATRSPPRAPAAINRMGCTFCIF